MGNNFPNDKINPDQVVATVLDSTKAGGSEAIIDDLTRFAKSIVTQARSRHVPVLGG